MDSDGYCEAQGIPGSSPGHAARACRATGSGKAPSSVSGQNNPEIPGWIAPCGCKKYPDGTRYKCLTHAHSHHGFDTPVGCPTCEAEASKPDLVDRVLDALISWAKEPK